MTIIVQFIEEGLDKLVILLFYKTSPSFSSESFRKVIKKNIRYQYGYNHEELLLKQSVKFKKFDLLHPRDQIVSIMNRVYIGEMATPTGGKLSVKDDDGHIFSTT